MCGIAGHVRFPAADEPLVRKLAGGLAHRGPDGEGFFHDGPVALGHRRLSIIDLGGGAQPQFNEDRSVAVVFNGEIYNYRELAKRLADRHQFRTVSDTEVLVHLYEEHGPDMVHHLRGMFAFALWDLRAQRLFLARDRFGKKPIYFVARDGAFTFASELGALLRAGVDPGPIEPRALGHMLELLYIPAPATPFRDVRKLPAGHTALFDRRGLTVTRYWSPPVPGSAPEHATPTPSAIRERLAESTRLRLRTDVPLAALLSGGVDSSAVVGLMAQELGPGIRTFSVGFGHADDELPFARLVAERHKTNHTEILIQDSVLEQTIEALAAYSEPFGDSSAVPTVAVCREVAKHVKVVLTGDGGDELFAGYGRYREVGRWPEIPGLGRLASALELAGDHRLARRGRKALRFLGGHGMDRYRAMIEVFSGAQRTRLLGTAEPARVEASGAPDDPADAAMFWDLNVYLPDDILTKVDVASMRWGLEARAPLLDHELAALVIPPPSRAKQDQTSGKKLLRAAVEDLVPPAIFARQKRGFGSPVGAWLTGPLRARLETVTDSGSWVGQHMDRAEVARTVAASVGPGGNPHQAWVLLSLETWARTWLSGASS